LADDSAYAPITSSTITLNAGTNAAPSIVMNGGSSGFTLIDTNVVGAVSAGQYALYITRGGITRMRSDTGLGWTAGAADAASDTSLWRAAAGVISLASGTTGTSGSALRAVPDSPSQITADQNNYQAGTGRSLFYRLDSDASRSITGFNPAGGTNQNGELHYFINVGSNNIVLVNESASSTAANRFTNVTGADITLAANEMAMLVYDNTSARWRVAKM
jgi:hypothetical protein